MLYRIHIVDDNPADADYLAALTENWLERNGIAAKIERHPSAEAFLFRYEEDKICDLLLLDIEMTGMDGVTLAKRIRTGNETVSIVFVTGYSDYIAEGYDVAALHYLMKPVRPEKFVEVLTRAMERRRREERALTLKTATETVRVPLRRLLYLESARNYVTVREEGGTEHTVRSTLREFEDLLDDRFFRVGRSFIVNLTKLASVTRSELHFPDGSTLPLPRGCYDAVNRAIINKL